jgi:CRISPR/Cas system CSM-associated protein Csm3 (group 7 of RAMP superfamily)
MRNHNAINRHTGAVLGSGLFSLESLPPGSHATVCLWLDETEMMTQDGGCSAKEFFADILSLLEAGLSLGGSAARGVGRVAMDGKALYKVFDCKNLEQQAALLDEHRAWRCGKVQKTGDSLSPSEAERTRVLTVELELAIPQGEDLLIGDGQGVDYDIEPQRVRCVDGVIRWKIPGSSLRGVFRGWFTRLAVRSGRPVADSLASKLERDAKGGVYSGDAVAWGFDSAAVRERKQDALMQDPARLESEVPCPIMRLFGSCYSKGRIQVADALSTAPQSPAQEQLRAHVAVDRITGGASEGFFFTNSVLSGEVKFPVTITVQDPGEDEVRWLRSTLRALHVGILRVGSSKAGGRLRLAGEVKAAGPFAELLKETSISEV